jgi:DNA-binding Xre family transcriptional regulator
MAKHVHKRYAQHLNRPHANEEKNAWMEDVKQAGMVPTLTILESCKDESTARDREIYWIHYCIKQGAPLTNKRVETIGPNTSKLIIRKIAKQKGLNQSQLQIRAGVTPQLLYRYWHNFTKSVELEQLEKIATALGVKPGDLIVPNAELDAIESSNDLDDAA